MQIYNANYNDVSELIQNFVLMERAKNSPNLQVREMNWHKHQFVV